ncbi:uncharacterized protein L969DRAFT_87416 [Mixia osmundae IAM 14324]|uniref:SH3 domain-containing protein n=1 Tax=Mixia osmundae (strain CBS 9802 / IAM 14324 / JCM 22182 / KY 12970) TaxID=764103 RepID=G7E0R4_MIXOS|nr:uncharacterized protein L969DRAFT_87416 [Mixia osmundae IAM 14324]KEI39457.1 hypothetical protein L969DRAFT_87416 [Mixia osmundae IAM 14324]GAA96424.1 hypothetical protein E5Q_03091 [Mixia osmundae IAM 14324]
MANTTTPGLASLSNTSAAQGPQVNIKALGGKLAVLGHFSGIQLFTPSKTDAAGQAIGWASNGASTFFSRTTDGALTPLGSTDAQGSINTICTFPSSGLVVLAGHFEQIQGVPALSIASYDPSTNAFSALGTGIDDPNGSVLTLYCDDEHQIVYAGGQFASPGASSNIAAWTFNTSTWSALQGLPTGLFDGQVKSISPFIDGTSLLIGGNFSVPYGPDSTATKIISPDGTPLVPTISSGTGSSSATIPSMSGSSSPAGHSQPAGNNAASSTYGGAANAPSASPAAGGTSSIGAEPASSSQSPIASLGSSLAPVSIACSEISGGPPTGQTGFSDPNAISCPAGVDGPGSTWLLADGSPGMLTVRLPQTVQAGGLRLGNTFLEGRGLTQFSVIALPSSQTLTLTYNSVPSDPNSTTETCNTSCPLAHDASLPYQDFLFPPGTAISGFQLNMQGWAGPGAGLHLLQLLSTGSDVYASGIQSWTCSTGIGAQRASSDVQLNTDLTLSNHMNIAADELAALPSAELVMTPYVAQSGNYDLTINAPPCAALGHCDHAAVTIAVISTATGHTLATQSILLQPQAKLWKVYSGFLRTNENAKPISVVLRPQYSGSLVKRDLRSALSATSLHLMAVTPNGSSANAVGLALFQYDTSNGVQSADGAVSQSTPFDDIGLAISAGASITSIVVADDNKHILLAGDFVYTNASSAASESILVLSANAGPSSSDSGLQGSVDSIVAYAGQVFAAGQFTQTFSGAPSNLDGLAQRAYASDSDVWAPLPSGGPSTAPTLLAISSDGHEAAILVASSGALSSFSPVSGTWSSVHALLLGNVTAMSSMSTDAFDKSSPTYLAGSIRAASQSSASQSAFLEQTSQGRNQLLPIESLGLSAATSSHVNALETLVTRAQTLKHSVRAFSRELFGHTRNLRARASIPSAPIPASLFSNVSAPEVAAAVFWSNHSHETMILGGDFIAQDGSVSLLAFDIHTNASTSFGQAIVGSVRSLSITENLLYVGGDFHNDATGSQGFSAYELNTLQWSPMAQALQPYDASDVIVNAVSYNPRDQSTVLVGGLFESAGAMPCYSICSWDENAKQWSSMRNGLQGYVSDIAWAVSGKDAVAYVVGSFTLNTTSNIAQWDAQAADWANMPPSDLPGPASAVTVDDYQVGKVFIAGASSDDALPYLSFFNGQSFLSIATPFSNGGVIQHMSVLPMSSLHESNGLLEQDRMLFVTGYLPSAFGNLSAALFDGDQWYPYLQTTTSDGTIGAIASLSFPAPLDSLFSHHRLSDAAIIAISIAISLGVIMAGVSFILGILALITSRQRKQAQKHKALRDADMSKSPVVIASMKAMAAQAIASGKEDNESCASSIMTAEPDEAVRQTSAEEDSPPVVMHARCAFDAEVPGELSLAEGEEVIVLQGQANEQWVYVASDTGNGIVPRNHLL